MILFFLQIIGIEKWRHVAPFAIRSTGNSLPFLVAGNQVLSAAPDDGPWAWTLPPLEICDSHYATADLKPIKGPTSEGDHY